MSRLPEKILIQQIESLMSQWQAGHGIAPVNVSHWHPSHEVLQNLQMQVPLSVLDPLASPLHANLADLPPMLLQVGDRETVLSDSTELARRAVLAGVDAHVEVWPGMFHVFQLYAAELPEAREAIARIGAHFRAHFDPPR